MSVQPERTNRGNYRCPFCKKMFKRPSGAERHMSEHHRQEMLDCENQELRDQLAQARKQLAAPKPKAPEERYPAVRYCEVCMTVDRVTVAKGHTLDDSTCFRCGILGGHPVKRVNVSPGSYE